MSQYLSLKQDFYRLFNATAKHQNPQETFADYVRISATALHNAAAFCQKREDQHLTTIEKYSDNDKQNLCHMLTLIIEMLESKGQPFDVLGEIYSELGLTNDKNAQFFTPFPVSAMCAKVTFDDELMKSKDFVTVSDPASGTGGMLLAFVREAIERGYNPANKVFVEATDVDEVVALCAYIQLSLWNVPSRVIVGNTLTLEYRGQWYTPAFYLFKWQEMFRVRRMASAIKPFLSASSEVLQPADFVVKDGQLSLF